MNLVKKDLQKYEYIVETVTDHRGAADVHTIEKVLKDKAANGWRLVSSFTNELGKNSVSVGGFGVNSTVDQTILIFEREIKREAESLFCIEAPIPESNLLSPFLPKSATFFEKDGYTYVKLRVFTSQSHDLRGLQGDLLVRNVFGDEVTLKDVCFFSFDKKSYGYLESSPFPVSLPDKISYGIMDTALRVQRYICNGKLQTPETMNIFNLAEVRASSADKFDADAFMAFANSLQNAADIYAYACESNEKYPSLFDAQIMHELSESVKFERIYGNAKATSLRALGKYFLSLGVQRSSDFDAAAFMSAVASMKNTAEIRAYMEEQNKIFPDTFDPDILEKMDKTVKIEKVYGSCKNSAINVLTKYFKDTGRA